MRKKLILFMLVIVMILGGTLLSSCTSPSYPMETGDEYRLTEERFDSYFQTAYGAEDLERHELYITPDKVEFQVFFREMPSESVLESLRQFLIKKMIFRAHSAYDGSQPYEAFLMERLKDETLKDVPLADEYIFVVCVKDKPVLVERYDDQLKREIIVQ